MTASWQNIIDHNGLSVAAAGLGIVFTALIILSLYITVLPKVLAWVHTWLPESDPATLPDAPIHLPTTLEEEVVAAAVAVHRARGGGKG